MRIILDVDSGGRLAPAEDANRAAIGDDTIAELSRKTGLLRAELVKRLMAAFPEAVNRLAWTPGFPSKLKRKRFI